MFSDDDEATTCIETMMIFGYRFAKNFGGPFPKNELLEDLRFFEIGRAHV